MVVNASLPGSEPLLTASTVNVDFRWADRRPDRRGSRDLAGTGTLIWSRQHEFREGPAVGGQGHLGDLSHQCDEEAISFEAS